MSNFGELINIEEFDKRQNFSDERGDVSFYCKDCKKIVETSRPNPKGYKFVCEECNGENVVIGTLEGLKTNYKL